MPNSPKTPEEALAHIKKAAEEGNITFAPSSQAEALDAEIQEVFATFWMEMRGTPPRRPIWASDQSSFYDVVDMKDGKVTEGALKAFDTAGAKLGIPLAISDLFVDAALRLRAKRAEDQS